MMASRRLALGTFLLGAGGIAGCGNAAREPQDPFAGFEGGAEVVPAEEAEDVPGFPLLARYWGEISPTEGRLALYRLYPGNVIYRGEHQEDLQYNYTGNLDCTGANCTDPSSGGTATLFTNQNEVTFIRTDNGACVSNNMPCGSGTNAPVPTTFPCNQPGTYCAPIQMTGAMPFPVPNPIIQMSQTNSCPQPTTSTVNCIEGCQDTTNNSSAELGLCHSTDPFKVDSGGLSTLRSLIRPVIANAFGCSYCYGNRFQAGGTLGGLQHVLLSDSNATFDRIYKDLWAMPLANLGGLEVTIFVRYAVPNFNASGRQIVMRASTGAVANCVVPGSSTVELDGSSFGPPGECFSAAPPTRCLTSGRTPGAGYAMQFPTPSGAVIEPLLSDYITWGDLSTRSRVPMGVSAGPMRIRTPLGVTTTADQISICP